MVCAASATAALTASAKLTGDVPTTSVTLYMPGMVHSLNQLFCLSYHAVPGLTPCRRTCRGTRREKLRGQPLTGERHKIQGAAIRRRKSCCGKLSRSSRVIRRYAPRAARRDCGTGVPFRDLPGAIPNGQSAQARGGRVPEPRAG